jgi:hypothetical protein
MAGRAEMSANKNERCVTCQKSKGLNDLLIKNDSDIYVGKCYASTATFAAQNAMNYINPAFERRILGGIQTLNLLNDSQTVIALPLRLEHNI